MDDSIDPTRAISILARCEVFRNLSPHDLQSLLSVGVVHTLEKGELIFAQGEDRTALHIVLTGLICIEVSSAEGHRLSHRQLVPGELFGEIAVLDGGPRTAAAIAMQPSGVFSIRRAHCLAFLERHPSCALGLATLLAQRIRATSHLLEDTLFLSARDRVGRMLIVLAEGRGKPLRGGRVIEVTHEELSRRTGLHRVSVTNQLQRLQEMQLVEIDRGVVLVRDIAQLEASCGR